VTRVNVEIFEVRQRMFLSFNPRKNLTIHLVPVLLDLELYDRPAGLFLEEVAVENRSQSVPWGTFPVKSFNIGYHERASEGLDSSIAAKDTGATAPHNS